MRFRAVSPIDDPPHFIRLMDIVWAGEDEMDAAGEASARMEA